MVQKLPLYTAHLAFSLKTDRFFAIANLSCFTKTAVTSEPFNLQQFG
jgi:hypothetical protein